jgi:hypothetical protein
VRYRFGSFIFVLKLSLAAIVVFPVFTTFADQPSQRLSTPVKVLRLSPSVVRLGGANRQQQLLITAEDVAGRLFDVTHLAEVKCANRAVARLSDGLVVGVSEGSAVIDVRYNDLTLQVPVEVKDFATYPPVHFRNDVVPLLSKLGCNSGGCHGKQGGQNGFKLSVFGFDPRSDYDALTKEARGRRVFPGDPAQSLFVRKATGETPHGGGRRIEGGSPDERLLIEWVKQGTPWGHSNAPQVSSIEIEPTDRVLNVNADQQILVTAIYSDGSRADVTSAAAYTTNADTVAKVDQSGRVQTGRRPGEAAITVNYMGHVGAVRVIVPKSKVPNPYPILATNNHVDELVWQKLERLGLLPSELCDDATFLRRLYLDSIGTMPTPNEVREFLADSRQDKRRVAVERVLGRQEFADYWALKWADILLVDQEKLGERGAYEFHRWLRIQMASNRPYDQWVRELLTASGNSGKYGPANFYRALRTPEELTRSVSQAFLGIRMDCAQCDHHPFEKWAQEDFYGLAGFFSGLQRKQVGTGREFVYHAGYQATKLPLTGDNVLTRPPGGAVPSDIDDGDPRIKLADWVTGRDNPWFARLVANRLWKQFLGRGLVEPEDDLRSTNPATNEPLLAYLSKQVVENDYDLKTVMRLILNSRVYQLSSVPNESNFDDEQNYSHHLVKRIPAEVLLDAISQATGQPETFPGAPAGTRAIALWDNRLPSYFLDTFGRSERQSACECGKSGEPTMAQALHLMNAPEIEAKVSSPDGRVAKLLSGNLRDEQIASELCLAVLGRTPQEKERKIAERLLATASRQQAAEDLLWTLLNSYDFLFIH